MPWPGFPNSAHSRLPSSRARLPNLGQFPKAGPVPNLGRISKRRQQRKSSNRGKIGRLTYKIVSKGNDEQQTSGAKRISIVAKADLEGKVHLKGAGIDKNSENSCAKLACIDWTEALNTLESLPEDFPGHSEAYEVLWSQVRDLAKSFGHSSTMGQHLDTIEKVSAVRQETIGDSTQEGLALDPCAKDSAQVQRANAQFPNSAQQLASEFPKSVQDQISANLGNQGLFPKFFQVQLSSRLGKHAQFPKLVQSQQFPKYGQGREFPKTGQVLIPETTSRPARIQSTRIFPNAGHDLILKLIPRSRNTRKFPKSPLFPKCEAYPQDKHEQQDSYQQLMLIKKPLFPNHSKIATTIRKPKRYASFGISKDRMFPNASRKPSPTRITITQPCNSINRDL